MEEAAALVQGLVGLARRAAAAILDHYREAIDHHHKSDGSPVTAADRAAEAIILEGLARLTPRLSIVSEEAFSEGRTPDIALTSPFWLVDPLDGTKEFLRRNGEFTVNIALVTAEAPILGVVLLPATGECFGGAVDQGAFRQIGDGGAEPIQARRPPAEGLTVLSSRSHADDRALAEYLAPLKVRERVIAGSSLKFCRIAEGRADLYPRFGPTMEWDTAAGHAILSAAGGSVTSPDGAPFRYGKPGFGNGAFVARGL